MTIQARTTTRQGKRWRGSCGGCLRRHWGGRRSCSKGKSQGRNKCRLMRGREGGTEGGCDGGRTGEGRREKGGEGEWRPVFDQKTEKRSEEETRRARKRQRREEEHEEEKAIAAVVAAAAAAAGERGKEEAHIQGMKRERISIPLKHTKKGTTITTTTTRTERRKKKKQKSRGWPCVCTFLKERGILI